MSRKRGLEQFLAGQSKEEEEEGAGHPFLEYSADDCARIQKAQLHFRIQVERQK